MVGKRISNKSVGTRKCQEHMLVTKKHSGRNIRGHHAHTAVGAAPSRYRSVAAELTVPSMRHTHAARVACQPLPGANTGGWQVAVAASYTVPPQPAVLPRAYGPCPLLAMWVIARVVCAHT